MMFPRSIWDDVGPLHEVQHGEETEWCIRAVEKGYKLIGVPRESVYHHPHAKSEYKKEYNNLLWLLKLHPTFPFRVLKSVFYKMSRSNYDDDATLKYKD
jgi:GT2 family glycosyltransferase